MQFKTENPYTFESLGEYPAFTDEQVDQAISRNFAAWKKWKLKDMPERARALRAIASGLRSASEALARQMALEIGKPISDAKAEIEKSAAAFIHIAENFPAFLATESVNGLYAKTWIEKTSVGPVLTLMPWNYPLWQLIRFAGPGLLVGNTILFKGAAEVIGTSDIIAQIFQRELPFGVFENVLVEHERIEKLIADPRVRGVTFTGSVGGGRIVASLAGKHLKKSVMELGGSDAYVVMPDADLGRAAKICASARLVNNGQSCISGKRFFVPQNHFNQFLEHFKAEMQSPAFGDPLDPETQLGPLASRRHTRNLAEQVKRLEADADCHLVWQKEMKIQGAQFAPQIWRVGNSVSWVHHEEYFGPVALAFAYDDIGSLPDFINQSSFGLGAGILGQDLRSCRELGKRLEVGMVVHQRFSEVRRACAFRWC